MTIKPTISNDTAPQANSEAPPLVESIDNQPPAPSGGVAVKSTAPPNGLRSLRTAAGLTLKTAGARVNLTAPQLSRLETGTRRLTGADILALADLYGTTTDRVLGRPTPLAAECAELVSEARAAVEFFGPIDELGIGSAKTHLQCLQIAADILAHRIDDLRGFSRHTEGGPTK